MRVRKPLSLVLTNQISSTIDRIARTILIVALISLSAARCNGQSKTANSLASASASDYSIEKLNLVGADVSLPLISDTVFGTESGFRRALFSHGLLLQGNSIDRITLNLLDAPVPPEQQVYIGQRPTLNPSAGPILTADLRQLHLHNAQFNIGAGWKWTNWIPSGPRALSLRTLYFYKMWGDDRVEMKVGYVSNEYEFVGMQVGGSLSNGSLGVYAVLPYEVGMSNFPLTAPSLNFRVRGVGHTYLKTAAQRSLDAAGGLATSARNQTGFRFIPKGDRLLLINEVGYRRASSPTALQAWFRAGYLYNETLYANKATGQMESGNYCAYVLMDHQISRPNPRKPGHGIYLGGTAMTAPAKFNSYDRYYEIRAYKKAPFESRPDDVVSFVATYTGFCPYVTTSLTAQRETFWRNSHSLTGSYTTHVSRGNYLTLGLGYVRGPAITPRVADALTLTANWGVYF